jgi:hypothetical protein
LPDLTAAPLSVVEGWKIAMRYSRVTKYRHFSDEQFAEFLGRSAALQLNPLSGQVYGALRPDPETRMPIVTLIVGIAGFRSIAQRTGERAGVDPVEFVMGNRTTTFKAPDPADPARAVTHTRPVPESATAHDLPPRPGRRRPVHGDRPLGRLLPRAHGPVALGRAAAPLPEPVGLRGRCTARRTRRPATATCGRR